MSASQELILLRTEVERLRVLATDGAALLEAILDHSTHGIIVTDLHGKLALQNRSAEQIVFSAEKWDIARVLKDGASIPAKEIEVELADGGRAVLLGSAAPIFDRDARISGVLLVFVDVTKPAEARSRVALLQSIIAAMSKARTVREVIDTVVERTQAALRATSASVYLIENDEVAIAGVPVGEERMTPRWTTSSGRSIATVPLRSGEEILGTMIFNFAERRDFQDEERQLIEAVAEHCAQALDRARLYDREARARHNAELLFLLSNALNRANTIGDVLKPALKTMARAILVDRAAILLVDEKGVMRFQEWIGLSEEYRTAVEGHSPWSPNDKSPRPIFINDTERDESVAPFREALRREGIRALGFIPLTQNEKLLGKLMVYSDRPSIFSQDDTVLALTICTQTSQAIHKAQLFDAERAARQEAEASHARALLLLDASIVLASSLDYRKTLDQLCELAVPRMADWMSVELENVKIVRPLGRSLPITPALPLDHSKSQLLSNGPASVVVVPMEARGRIFGRITFAALESGRRYRAADVEMAEMLGRRAGIAIDNALLYEAEARTRALAEHLADRMHRLQQAIAAIGESLTLEAIFSTALEHTCTVIGVDAAWIFLADENGTELVLASHRGVPEELIEPNRRVQKPERFPEKTPELGASVPMLLEGRCIGVISVGNIAKKELALKREDWSFLAVVARQCAYATSRARLYDALRDADRRKDEFLAVLAHELRNPLAPIRSAVGVLRLRGPQDEVIAHARDVIDRQAAHMARMVDDLLDVSRITRGKILLKEEEIDLVDVVRSTIEDHRSIIESNRLNLILRVPSENLRTRGDRTRLAQVVGNLLHNATKFTEAGGAIEVEVKRVENNAELVIRDNGTGIQRDLLDRIFEPFSQEERSLARTRGGLGLGLALVKGLVELHGGSVRAWSEGPGCGAELTVTLPLRATIPPVEEAAHDTAEPSMLKVLVIEDNDDAADMLAMLLELYGHTVQVGRDGSQGLAKAKTMKPDLILCDIGLPGELDGYAVARALRGDPDTATSFVVALTGYGQEDDRQRARAAGFDVHATKPLDADRLLEIIESVGHQRRGR